MHTIERIDGDQWVRGRAVRLRALRDAPDAFWMTAEGEAGTSVAAWRAQLSRRDAATFLAVVDGEDVGMAVGAPHHADPVDAGLYAMWVAPSARGRGVGDALIAAVVEWARAAGHPRIRLEVGDHNAAAIGLYARTGFTPTGATSRFPAPRDHITEHERARDLRS